MICLIIHSVALSQSGKSLANITMLTKAEKYETIKQKRGKHEYAEYQQVS